jgi:hypothetical protein
MIAKKVFLIGFYALLCVAHVTWAQTVVLTEGELTTAIANGGEIRLGANIQLGSYLNIEGKTVTIDLNGHKLYRILSS